MTEPIELDYYRPHRAGQCICIHCGHTWIGVMPIGTPLSGLECSSCHELKAIYILSQSDIQNALDEDEAST